MNCFRSLPRIIVLTLLPALCLSLKAGDLPDRVIEYKKVGDGHLKLHLFQPADHKASDKKPAIVFFFGGGWSGGTPTQFFRQSRHLADLGFVAISAQYRTKKSHNTEPKTCVIDGKSAMRWVRAHAAELGIDPEKVLAGGGSAGGHVAACTASLSGNADFDEAGEDTTVSSRPVALVLFNPVIDTSPSGFAHKRVTDYWKAFSPLHNITKDTPPTILFYGTKDDLIPVATAQAYQKKMKNFGLQCDLHLYEGEKHGFFNGSKFKETITEMDKFLQELGYLKK